MVWAAKSYFGNPGTARPNCQTSAPGFSWTAGNTMPRGMRAGVPPANDGLPSLNEIMPWSAQTSYSCSMEYNQTALFLSAATQSINDPDLLWYGLCTGPYNLFASTGGTDVGFVSKVEKGVTLDKVTSDLVVHTVDDRSNRDFVRDDEYEAAAGDIVIVVRSTTEVRMWAAVEVKSIDDKTGAATFEFAVRLYETNDASCSTQSPGFKWDAPTKHEM